jgi:RNA polymerase sigma-70 factor (TIGR02943 family)
MHGDYLYSFALSKVRQAEGAEDLVQETLLSAWRSRDSFRGDSCQRTWLTGILRHKIVDWLRKRVRENNIQAISHDHLDQWFSTGGKWKQKVHRWRETCEVEYAEFLGVLHNCAERLPTRLRESFVLRHLEAKSTEDVCESLDLKAEHVWVLLHRARMRMWECLGLNWFHHDRSEKS